MKLLITFIALGFLISTNNYACSCSGPAPVCGSTTVLICQCSFTKGQHVGSWICVGK